MRPKTLWLNLLPTLDAILNARTLTEAADKAHITQPALSIALRKARAHFDDELVIFKGTRAQLTELGTALRPRVKAALQAARDALDCELHFDPTESTRTVRIMLNSYLEFAFLPGLLRQLYAQAPHLNIVIDPFTPMPINPNLLEDVDIIVAADSFGNPGYSSAPLFKDQLICMVWDQHPTIVDSLSTDDWLDARHATATAHPPTHEAVPTLIRELQASKRFALRGQSATTLPHMIVGTDLVITSMSRYCAPFTRYLPLKLVPIVSTPAIASQLNLNIAVYWKTHRSDEPYIRWLVEACQLAAKGV